MGLALLKETGQLVQRVGSSLNAAEAECYVNQQRPNGGNPVQVELGQGVQRG